MVDEFYDVIKIAHVVEKGKHAGQKKTYRLVSNSNHFRVGKIAEKAICRSEFLTT